MATDRKLAYAVGASYLLTFATSIPALALKQASFAQPDARALLSGAVVLEVVLALACVGTAVAFFPVGQRYSPALALGFVASRVLEASTVLLGVAALMGADAVREGGAEAGAAGLVAVHDAAFLLGPGLLPAINALLFGTVLYRARLVPRIIPLVGLIGAPLLMLSAVGSILGVVDQVSPIAGLAALPIALWEFSIGVWLIARGFAPREDVRPEPRRG